MGWNFSADGKLVRFETSDGMLLNGFIFPKKGSKKIVIHVPGMMSNFYDDRNFVHMAKRINEAGWNFFPFNNRGHDVVSDIPTSSGSWKRAGTGLEKFENSLKDIKAAVDFAYKMGYKKIILSGHSTGCQKVVYYQSKKQDRRVKGLILLGPADDYNSMQLEMGASKFKKTLEKARRSKNKRRLLPQYLTGSYIFSMERFLSAHDLDNVEARIFNYDSKMPIFKKVTCPILTVFGSRDEFRVKPVDRNFRILNKNTGSPLLECVVIKNANHSFVGKERQLSKEISKWLVENKRNLA